MQPDERAKPIGERRAPALTISTTEPQPYLSWIDSISMMLEEAVSPSSGIPEENRIFIEIMNLSMETPLRNLRDKATQPFLVRSDIEGDIKIIQDQVLNLSPFLLPKTLPNTPEVLLSNPATAVVQSGLLVDDEKDAASTLVFILQGSVIARDSVVLAGLDIPLPTDRLVKIIEEIAGSRLFTVVLFLQCDQGLHKLAPIPDFKCKPEEGAVLPLFFSRGAHHVVELASHHPFSFKPTPELIRQLPRLCPSSGTEICSAPNLSCLSFQLGTVFLHAGALLAEDLIAWFEAHFVTLRGVYYDGPATIELWQCNVQLRGASAPALRPPTVADLLRNCRAVYTWKNMNAIDVVQKIVKRMPISLQATRFLLRTILQCLPNKRMTMRHRVSVSQDCARNRLAQTIRDLPKDQHSAIQDQLSIMTTIVRTTKIEELCDLVRPPGAPSRVNEVKNDTRAIGLSAQIADDLHKFMESCNPQITSEHLNDLTIRLDPHIIEHGGHQHYSLMLECTTKQFVKIHVLAGGFFSRKDNNQLTALYPKLDVRSILMVFAQQLPSRVLISRSLRRSPESPIYSSVIVTAGLGQNLPHPIDNDSIDSAFFKGIVLRLSDPSKWTFEDFVRWLSQLAWVNNTLADWSSKIAKVARSEDFRQIFNGNKQLETWMPQWGFTEYDLLLIKRHIQEQANIKLMPASEKTAVQAASEQTSSQANNYLRMGNYKKANELYLEAQRQIEANKNEFSDEFRASVIGNLGVTYQSMGQFRDALRCHLENLRICETIVGDKATLGRSYANIGIAYQSLGKIVDAIEYHKKHLDICTKITHDVQGQGRAYCNLGISYHAMGDYTKAIECHQKHLDICLRKSFDRAGEGRAYANLGVSYQTLNEIDKAISYHFKHLRICVEETHDKRGEASAYGNLGNAYHIARDFQEAIKFHKKHLELCQEEATFDLAGQSKAYANLGNAHQSFGEYEAARQCHLKHLEISMRLGDRAGEAAAHNNLAHALFCMNRIQEGAQELESAVASYEFVRMSTGCDLATQHFLFQQHSQVYRYYQLFLVKTGDTLGALTASERMRANALVEMMSPTELQGIMEKITGQSLMQIAERRKCTFVTYSIIREENIAYVFVVRPECPQVYCVHINMSHEQLDSIETMVRTGIFHESITSAAPADLADLPGEEVLERLDLSALAGPVKELGWTQGWQVLRGLRAVLSDESSVDEVFPGLEPQVRKQLLSTNNQSMERLYTLLIEPFSDYLPKDPEELVVFVPYGPLYSVPFAALRTRHPNTGEAVHLIEKHTICIAPSILSFEMHAAKSELNQLKRQAMMRRGQDFNNVLVSGAGVGEKDDESPPVHSDDAMHRLCAAVQEWSATPTKVLTSATAEQAATCLPSAAVAHISAQLQIDERERTWVGRVNLNFGGTKAQPGGQLSAQTIGQMQLSVADMIFLDCVQPSTSNHVKVNVNANAKSNIVPVDGPMTVVRMLFKAGSPCVISTLWNGCENYGAEAEQLIYQCIWDRVAKYPTKAHALRHAMIQMQKQGVSPRQWARYVCYGFPTTRRDQFFLSRTKRQAEEQIYPSNRRV